MKVGITSCPPIANLMLEQVQSRSPLQDAVDRLSERIEIPPLSAKQLTEWAWRIRHRAWLVAREQPQLFYALARRRGFAANQLVGPSTQLVIEGFPRSANSYAVIGFQLAQPAWLPVAHHTHAPAQVIRAAEHGIPLLVPIRHPRDAIASLLIRDRRYSVDLAVEAYASFHETVLPYRSAMVLTRFEDVTRDLGGVIRQVNQRFGTSFGLPPSADAEFRQACFRMIEEIDTLSGGSEHSVARPSAWRLERKRELINRIQNASSYPAILELYEHAVKPRLAPTPGRSRVIVLSAS
jgi:hypothetical protein